MKYDLHLFINGLEVEFSQDPKILLCFKETDFRNPVTVFNSFSKQITVEGTNRNNQVFGCFYELTRIQEDMPFNPIKKADFQLFVNDNLFEKGYVKLDKVTRTNNTNQYTFTLYGGLGSFFYNLSYLEDSNKKKTLADLFYAEDIGYSEPDLDFTINKEAVNQAWGQLAGYGNTVNDRWNVINFVPAYNGIPDNLDPTSILINNYNLTTQDGFVNEWTEEGITYTPILNGLANPEGYSIGTANEDMTEWETRDLRSYMQRPAISMYRIMRAICNPANNGGYQVKLDSHFFRADNPYYRYAWLTMPLLKDLDGVGNDNTHTLSNASISTAYTTEYCADIHNIIDPSTVAYKNIEMSVNVRFNPDTTQSVTYLFPYSTYRSNTNFTLKGSTYVQEMIMNQGIVLEMLAYGSNGNVIGQSEAYFLGQSEMYPGMNKQMWSRFYKEDGDLGTPPTYHYIKGKWKKVGSNYVFVDDNDNQVDIKFSFTAPVDYSSLKLKVKTPFGYSVDYAFAGNGTLENENSMFSWNTAYMWTNDNWQTSGNHTKEEAFATNRISGKFSFAVTSFKGVSTNYEGFFSNSLIRKKTLLTTEYTPAEYMLSYCKLFGLYFYYDATEESDDPDIYPKGVIHIMDRDTFYTDEYVDLNELIDWDKKLEITPALASSKYYSFDLEQVESEVGAAYLEDYGSNYGSQLINTNYNFDSNTTELYDGNIFKGAIMALEKDKYFKKTAAGLPVYQYNGLTYNLFNRPNVNSEFQSYEIEFPATTTILKSSINEEYDGFDTFPKLQFHTEENSPSDGSNVLVFFRNGVNVNCDYWLTDDLTDMVTLNGSNPTWIFTRSEYNANGNRIAYRLMRLPYFTREMTFFKENGNITHSWNFGHPQLTYVPDLYTTPGDDIYDKCWKSYIGDMYNQDTRKLTCYVKTDIDGYPWVYWMRRYYWFENCIWRLNEIKDLNVSSWDVTKMEFVKVIDPNNYKLNRIEYYGENGIIINNTEVSCEGGTVSGKVYIQGNGTWRAPDHIWGYDGQGIYHELASEDVMTPYRGTGTTNFTITFPENEGATAIEWNIGMRGDDDKTRYAYLIQRECVQENTLVLDTDIVACSGGTITGTMYMNTDDTWVAADNIWGEDLSGQSHTFFNTMDPYSGVGFTATPFTLTVPENMIGGEMWWNVTTRDSYRSYTQRFFQPYCPPGENYLELSGDTVSCSGGSIQGFMHMGTNANWIADNLWCEDLSGVTHYLTKEDHIIPYSGLGETTTPFVMTVPANTLSATMVWNIDINDTSGGSYSSTFYQPYCEPAPIPSSISATPQSVSAYSSGRTYVFNITCSGTVAGVTATTDVNWITANTNATYNPTALTVVIAPNNTFTGRMATVNIAGTGTQGPVSTSVQVTQNGKVAVAITPSTINVNKESGTVIYNYSVSGYTPGVDGGGFINYSGNWIERATGLAGQQIQVDYTTNNTSGSRTGTITYTGRRDPTIYGATETASTTARLIQSNQATVVPIVTNKDNLVLDYPASRTDSVILTTASGWTSTIIDN